MTCLVLSLYVETDMLVFVSGGLMWTSSHCKTGAGLKDAHTPSQPRPQLLCTGENHHVYRLTPDSHWMQCGLCWKNKIFTPATVLCMSRSGALLEPTFLDIACSFTHTQHVALRPQTRVSGICDWIHTAHRLHSVLMVVQRQTIQNPLRTCTTLSVNQA